MALHKILHRISGKVLFEGEFGSFGLCIETAVNQDAELQGAKLQGAKLDFSCWPLWCGSLDAGADAKISTQLLYHLLRSGDNEVTRALRSIPEVVEIANNFHRVDECGRIE
jgi:hypothetical protein